MQTRPEQQSKLRQVSHGLAYTDKLHSTAAAAAAVASGEYGMIAMLGLAGTGRS